MILENHMRAIIQVLPSFHTGGVEQTTLLVANALAEKGFKSFIASSGGILTKKLHPKVTHIEMPLKSKNPYVLFCNMKRLKKIIEKQNIDIVHARSRAPAWSAYFAAKLAKAHFLTTYHGAYSQNSFKRLYNRVMAMGEVVIVASSFMEKHVNQYYPNTRCARIASGIDTHFFSCKQVNQQKSEDLKAFWEVNISSKIILLVGRFTPIKGHHLLLKAVNESAFRNQIKVVFVGDSKNPELVRDLKKQADKHNLNLYIHLDENDLRPFFYLADVVVVPTVKPEAFGRVTVEAMSMERVVIVNDLGASKEILADEKWVFDHLDTRDLTQKIDRALRMSSNQKVMIGKENRLRAVTHYDVETLIESHMDLYKRFFKEV